MKGATPNSDYELAANFVPVRLKEGWARRRGQRSGWGAWLKVRDRDHLAGSRTGAAGYETNLPQNLSWRGT